MPMIENVTRWAGALLARRHAPARHARTRPEHHRPRRLYVVRHVPSAWSAGASTVRQRPPAHLPRAAAWPYIVFEEASPVRPYVLPPAERGRMLREAAR
ncbi:hypothetical protein [Streptomyces sp. enrichment culture]|uniref:hypothetical protein n=1 Tax=Streptomyces sp. enrichment culture TaxID=1795815 RepID=UPI003F5683D3